MANLKTPLTDSDHQSGPLSAEVTLIEYGDYQCPYCRAALPIVESLKKTFSNNLNCVFRYFPLKNLHPEAFSAACAAEAAGEQGKFWEMHRKLFAGQEDLSPLSIKKMAETINLDLEKFMTDWHTPHTRSKVDMDLKNGLLSGVNATPTYFINSKRFDESISEARLMAAVQRAIEESK